MFAGVTYKFLLIPNWEKVHLLPVNRHADSRALGANLLTCVSSINTISRAKINIKAFRDSQN